MVDQSNTPNYGADSEAIRREVEREFEAEYGPVNPVEPDLEVLESLEDEVGLREVDLNQAVIDTVATDDTDDNLDVDDDGVADDADDQEAISNLPQEYTESYGTGLQGQPSDRAGTYSRRGEHMLNAPDYVITGGDVDANYEDANAVGEEGVGGTVSTPDQDIVDEVAAAVGLEMDDRSFLRTNDVLEERDDRRWELDPKSSEDYQDRRD
ncbi:DUF6335 family protein [Oscillatoria sp. FACHB-1407]|uniref:DUF6335 family protein n=1 Tax=Oscillatoria sp. FACHB-1407 TaxID=2692847 RepID=UPI001F54EE36|nr:DUF6335 family protein [Oscillatoria sp. FACHB-1407]